MSDNAIDKMSPEDRCNPVKAVKIGYVEICREIGRAHRRLPAKSLIAMNRVTKFYQSEANEILKECSKLDRMLIRRNNPEAETESNSTVSIEEIMSGIKSARKESYVSEKSASEDPSKLNDATIDDEEFSTETNPGNNIDAAGYEIITSTPRNSSKQKTTNSNGSRKRTRTFSRAISTQTEEDPQPSSSRQRIQKPLLPSLPFGQLIVLDKNGTPCKLVIMSINPNYYTNFNK
ncbi:unnamed protein product [Pieris macdunnoughi]|uniref:Uncharacterized protein n=1 Tax=Pieris macdunnoughi TaxID=345717 RepID=A0A821PDU7_9NEOP|nr:unnamed protein product [Pieris macdunnoughi]